MTGYDAADDAAEYDAAEYDAVGATLLLPSLSGNCGNKLLAQSPLTSTSLEVLG